MRLDMWVTDLETHKTFSRRAIEFIFLSPQAFQHTISAYFAPKRSARNFLLAKIASAFFRAFMPLILASLSKLSFRRVSAAPLRFIEFTFPGNRCGKLLTDFAASLFPFKSKQLHASGHRLDHRQLPPRSQRQARDCSFCFRSASTQQKRLISTENKK